MPKHTEEVTGDIGLDTGIEIAPDIRKHLPKEIDISDIGKIDLREAEDIAREEMTAFIENEFGVGTQGPVPGMAEVGAPKDKEPPKEPVPVSAREFADAAPAVEQAPPDRKEEWADYEDGRKWVPIEELANMDIENDQWVPLERIKEEPAPIDHSQWVPLERIADEVAAEPEMDSSSRKMTVAALEEIVASEEEKPAAPPPVFGENTVLAEAAAAMPGEYDGTELDSLANEIVQFEEGVSYTMKEADVEEDRELVAHIVADFESGYDDQFIDWEKRYHDEELDFVHAAIVEEDYSKYIWEIDDFSDSTGVRTFSSAVELLGLTADEQDSIEDLMFDRELKSAGIYGRYQLFEFEKSGKGNEGKIRKNYRYLLPREDSLLDLERTSIENDISSGTALIFEEDVEEIKNEFMRKTGKAILDDYQIDAITDITDRVVILDDESDVERFVQTFPEKRQVDIKTLLKYLNGLFDKLPEEAIKKFAGSEYFDLYLKVLNELGV
jgi:hypothetical protein